MAKSCIKRLFKLVERIKTHNSCQLYLYYLAMLLQFILFGLYLFEGEVYSQSGPPFALRTTLTSLMKRENLASEEKPGYEENDSYLAEYIFLGFQCLFTIALLVVFLSRAKGTAKSILEKGALAYTSTYSRLLMSGGFQIATEIFANYMGYLALERREGTISFAEIVLCIAVTCAYAAVLCQVIVIIFLWNDVFWDSPLPWASFGSEIPTLLQQIIAFSCAMCSEYGPLSVPSAKPYLLFAFFTVGVLDLSRLFYGVVPYSPLTMYVYMTLQSLVTGSIPCIVIVHIFGKDLDLLVVICSALCGITLAVCSVLTALHYRESVLNRESNKKNSSYEKYFAFLMYLTIRSEEKDLTLRKFYEEHCILCDGVACPCSTISADIKNSAAELYKPENKLKWFKLLGKVIDAKLGETSEAEELWIVRYTLMLLGENNPYKCMVEIEAVLTAHSYGISTKHILHQMRRRCKEKIREKFRMQGEGEMCARVLELYENEQESNALKDLMDNAAESALSFWRELSQKGFRVDRFQEKGSKLLNEYGLIQEKAKKLFSGTYINSEITFSYSLFVKKVMNHAMEEMAMLNNIKAKNSLGVDKGFINGLYEKTATIVARASKTDICTITSTNKKISTVLGYQPHQLIGKDINCLMTPDVSKNHDRYVKGYINRGIVNGFVKFPNLSFGVRKDGFLQPLQISIMLLPCFGDGLYFIALLQNAVNDRISIWTRPNYKMQKYCFVLSNKDGDILGVTKNCVKRFGLAHPQFVSPNEAQFKSLYKLPDLIPDLNLPAIMNKLNQKEEIDTEVHTELVAGKMEKEAMQVASCTAILKHAGTHPILLGKEKIQYTDIEQHVYKIVGTPQPATEVLKKADAAPAEEQKTVKAEDKTQHQDTDLDSAHSASDSSASASSTAQNTKEFKQLKMSILDKSMPRILKVVNLSVIVVMALIIIFGGVTLNFTQRLIDHLEILSESVIVSYRRRLEQGLCRMEIRTIADIANDIEENVNGTRFDKMQATLAMQLQRLSESQNMVQHLDKDLLESNVYETKDLYQTQMIEIDYSISTAQLPANVAIYNFVTSGLLFSTAPASSLRSDFYLMQINGTANKSTPIRYVDQIFYKTIKNGFGRDREIMRSSTTEFSKASLTQLHNKSSTLNAFFYTSLGLVALWFAILFPMMIKIHFNKRDVLSVYSDVKLTTLSAMIANCIYYLKKSKQVRWVYVGEDQDDVPSEKDKYTAENTNSRSASLNPATTLGPVPMKKTETPEDTEAERRVDTKNDLNNPSSSVVDSAVEEEKAGLNKEDSEKVGKREEFRKFDQTFAYQLGVLIFFCCGLCSYYIYKFIKFSDFINDSDAMIGQLGYISQNSQNIVEIVGMSKEAWMQGKDILSSEGIRVIDYYLKACVTIDTTIRQTIASPHPAFVGVMKEMVEKIETAAVCEYGIKDKSGCLAFWNGILEFGLFQAANTVIHFITENYFTLFDSIATGKYSPGFVKSILRSKGMYNSETFIYDYLYPTFLQLMSTVSNDLDSYFQTERLTDQIEYVVVALAIFILLCTLWLKFLFILDAQMWKTKAILVFLPTEFMQQIDKTTQNFILSILGK